MTVNYGLIGRQNVSVAKETSSDTLMSLEVEISKTGCEEDSLSRFQITIHHESCIERPYIETNLYFELVINRLDSPLNDSSRIEFEISLWKVVIFSLHDFFSRTKEKFLRGRKF